MAKYYGNIGYLTTIETSPGIWEESIIEKTYYGDVISMSRRWSHNSSSTNDDFMINNRISIIADEFAYNNLDMLRYIVWMGKKWKINSIEIESPRLILSIEGVYNGKSN